MKIHIDDMEISCIIGLLDFERETEQRVILTIEIDYHHTKEHFIDYGEVASSIKAHLRKRKYLLLEEALSGIKALLFQQFPSIEILKIKISKPDILHDCSVGLSERWINTSL